MHHDWYSLYAFAKGHYEDILRQAEQTRKWEMARRARRKAAAPARLPAPPAAPQPAQPPAPGGHESEDPGRCARVATKLPGAVAQA